MKNTKIEWATHTFNPWQGCAKVSPACDNCYAEKYGNRFGIKWGAGVPRKRTSKEYWKQPLRWNNQARLKQNAWEHFKEANPLLTDKDLIAKGFTKPVRPRVFCASLADVFDNEVPTEWRADLLDVIGATPNLDWLLLTKRIGNAQKMLSEYFPSGWENWVDRYQNVWLGATICNQDEVYRDVPKLMEVPAAKLFLSIEPMLGEIDLMTVRCVNAETGDVSKSMGPIHWVICGGESGAHARPMHPHWVRSLRDQCVANGVPFFFKQWGEWFPRSQWEDNPELILPDDDNVDMRHTQTMQDGEVMHKVGKKAAGRVLDGRTWEEMPV